MPITLLQFLRAKRGRSAQLAKAIGVSVALVSMWAHRSRRVPAERCAQVHAITGVNLSVLRPDLYSTRGRS